MDALTAAIRASLNTTELASGLRDQLAQTLERNIRHQCGGTTYLARRASREQIQERNAQLRQEFNGRNLEEVAKRHGLNARTVRRYVTGK